LRNNIVHSNAHVVKSLRSEATASRAAFGALLLRDIAVLRKNLSEFIPRTIIQPFLLVFVFLYVFPQIGMGIGGGSGLTGESRFAAVLISGVVGLSIMFQGIQAVALPLATEFCIIVKFSVPIARKASKLLNNIFKYYIFISIVINNYKSLKSILIIY